MTTFDEFWRWYRAMHARRETRILHAVATSSAVAILAAAVILRAWPLALLAPLVDHAIAQTAHRIFERNATRPWRHPIWHLRAELRLFREVCGVGVSRR